MKCGAKTTSCMARSGDECMEHLITETPSCKGRIPLTNADRIRSMNDEELSVWLVDETVCERVCKMDEYCHGDECVERVTEWLKRPAKEE